MFPRPGEGGVDFGHVAVEAAALHRAPDPADDGGGVQSSRLGEAEQVDSDADDRRVTPAGRGDRDGPKGRQACIVPTASP